jgi:YD repeat-containing protein
MPNWICDPASGFYYGGYMISDARAVVHWAFCDPPRPPSGLCADTEEDGLTASACYCADCRPRPAVRREAGMDRAQTDVPLGVSSGLTNADLRIKAVLAEYKAGDAVRQMINLDTAVIEHSENAGEGWEFATVKRPSGAEVTFALCGQKAGRPLNAERRYRLARNGAALELRFAGTDLVVHRFDAAGAIAQVRKTFAHVEVGVNGSPTNWPGMIVERDTGSVRRISSPVYTVELRRVGGLVAAVDYLDAGGALQQTLEILSGSRIFRLLDAGGAAIEETKIVSTGNVEEIWLGVGAGGASAAAKQIAEMAYDRTNLLTTRTLTTIYHPGGADESRAISCEVSQGFPWGEELVAQTEGFGSADPQTTSYAYYTNPAITGCFGRLRLAEYPDGSWVRYEYDGLGRANAVYRPLKNAPPSAGGGDCRLAEYFYAADPSLAGFGFPLDDVTATNDPRPRLIVEKIGGVEVTRTYHSYAAAEQRERRCANQGADYGDSENLVTKTEAYTTGAFQGRVRRILHPDGTLSVFSYAYNPASDELTVVRETGAGSGYGVTSGKRTTTVRDSADRIVSIRIEDIESDMCLSETQYERDGWGRVLRELNTVTHSERRMEYGCCGPERLIDDEGIETTIGYDELKQPVVTTRNGVTAVTAYDARGNVVSVTRTAAGCPPLGTVNTYDACGRLIAARDERGFTTTLAYGINGLGERTVTATYPDHSTSIDTVYRDGQPHSLKGTAVHPLVYDYGADVDGSYTVEYRGDDSCGLPSEWIRTSTDMLGRNAKIVYPGGYTETFSYDSLGRLVKTSDGLTAQLFAYNALGEMWREARDMNGNGAIDPAGNDKLTETETAVATFGGKDVRETTVRVYPAAGSGVAEVLAVMRTALEGSETWSTTLGRTRHVVITRNPAAAARTVTVTNPDGTHSIACYTNNLLMASVETDRTGATVSERRCRYDAFGRLRIRSRGQRVAPGRKLRRFHPRNVIRLRQPGPADSHDLPQRQSSGTRVQRPWRSRAAERFGRLSPGFRV